MARTVVRSLHLPSHQLATDHQLPLAPEAPTASRGVSNITWVNQLRIRLGWSHLALLASEIAGMVAVVWIMFMPQWEERYVREAVVPQLERRSRFRLV